MEAYIDGEIPELPYAKEEAIGRTIDYSAGRNRYIGYLMTIPSKAFNGYRVGLDCANGASSMIAKSVFEALGAKTTVINNQPDGININDNCGSTHIEKLQELVRTKGLDVGFAYDGDADRCLAVDADGKVVNGDQIMYLCGKHMRENGQLDHDMIVTTVMTNLGFYKTCDANGLKYQQTAVGDKYVAENMMANGYVLGGEQSGHIIFGKYATTGDGILTSLMVMQTMLEKKMPLAMMADEMRIYPQVLKNIKVHSKEKTLANEKVKAAVKAAEKGLGNAGRILVRESGTEPKIRVMVEADTTQECEKWVDSVIDVIRAEGLALS